jgi:hypothetical protein
MCSKQPQYRFYATLLDGYSYYLSSESENSFNEFIDRINRVPFTSEAAAKGTSFNALIDSIIQCDYQYWGEGEDTIFDGFKFPNKIIAEYLERLNGAIPQVRTSAMLETSKGSVEVYGIIDEILPYYRMVDIKTTSSWIFPKYLEAWQHIVYPYCFWKNYDNIIYDFSYWLTDFKNVTEESYRFNPEKDIPKLVSHCESLIDFIEMNRSLITDEKIFVAQPELITNI